MQKPPCPNGQRRLRLDDDYCFFSVVSVLVAELEDDGAVEPLAALLPLLGAGVGAAVLLELVEPPAALSFLVASEDAALEDEDGVLGVVDALDEELSLFFDASTLIDVEPEPDGCVPEADDDAEPDGAAGVVEEDDDAEPDGPEAGEVVVLRETARSPSRSQPVRMPAPSARETATAKVVSLICIPPWVGVQKKEQGTGPAR